ncbi:O-antigen ligase family protein [Ochrobactrum quorumnocens]|uniref:O-antigen ligase family protein n=1 Tax=Ochrobactrum quorumnocens TaxID=271865 RepID=A0A5N1JZ93_9HYPH|nr:O-antigen ligase [[Ochrobactrum] quorumnocens]KAA9368559.1 O-antigen ligase family protein [[Ochrobactrum] quorumnocens]MBD7989823.1 O-antigen ligase family protein [Ochrobactrum gallinarum]
MSSTATRTRTNPGSSDPMRVTMRQIALVTATVIFCILLISFRPFSPAVPADGQQAGDAVNQLGFGLVGAIALASLAMFAEPGKVLRLVSLGWLLMFGLLLASAFVSPDPSTAIRGIMLTLIGVLAIVAVLALPQDADGYSWMLLVVASIVIFISYAGVVLLPNLGTHGADAGEPQNSFLWRGVFTHKNIAGPVMAIFAFAGIYLWRRGWRFSGALIALFALFFVAHTGSKTTAALVPFAMLLVIGPGMFGMRGLAPLMIFAIQVVFALFTIGTVLFEPLHQIVLQFSVDPTFTGRTSIWAFAIDALHNRPWIGFGYESFWGAERVKEAANPYYLDWDVRGIVHGHNGYLDITLSMGLIGLICAIVVIIIMPLVNYMRCRPTRENLFLADFFLMFVFFGTLNAMLESFFFRRMDPVWLMLIFAIFGLRMTAKVTILKRAI